MKHKLKRSNVFAVAGLVIGLNIGTATGQQFTVDELMLANGLEAVLARPAAAGQRYPLVLISHGSPRDAEDRRKMSPLSNLPQAIEFARRGWASVTVMRRGYGKSSGNWEEDYGRCNDPDYVKGVAASVADLRSTVDAIRSRTDVDAGRIVAVGRSAGGIASVALSANPPPGLVAAINFAGGRGSRSDSQVCKEERLVEAMHKFGQKSQLPNLWVYAENDKYFSPALAKRMHAAFVSAGGDAKLVIAPPFGKDGHTLFSLAGTSKWTPIVDQFIKSIKTISKD
jgi:dienelactone hydrolase